MLPTVDAILILIPRENHVYLQKCSTSAARTSRREGELTGRRGADELERGQGGCAAQRDGEPVWRAHRSLRGLPPIEGVRRLILGGGVSRRSGEHTCELQSTCNLVF